MGEMQDALVEMLGEYPRPFLEKMVAKKLGLSSSPERVKMIVDFLMTGGKGDLKWDGAGDSPTVEFTAEDCAELTQTVTEFYKVDLPKIVATVRQRVARLRTRTLKKAWAEQHAWQKIEHFGFQTRLELRWGRALDLLRMLLTCALELGSEIYKVRRSRYHQSVRGVLHHLHARACQVTKEIIVLLENGFADGAMARWRTLHEIGVVACVIAQGDEKLAERYLAHKAVEAKKALDAYQKTCKSLGCKPINKRDVAKINTDYQKVKEKYGEFFCRDYGWAAEYLNNPNPNFTDHLQSAAARSHMRPYYRMASYNVHAGVNGIMFRLGLMGSTNMLLAGSSNAGLNDPGQNTAITLSQLTALLFQPPYDLDTQIQLEILALLAKEASDSFVTAGKQLEREENEKPDGRTPTRTS